MNTIIMHMLLFASLYFEVFLLIIFFEWRAKERATKRQTRQEAPESILPSVTIIVPCFNEATTVTRTLRSLLALAYPQEKLRIIAVDDGSTDDTWDVLRTFESCPNVRLVQKENGGKHTALNAVLPGVTTDLVGCLDADSFVAQNALREIVRYFSDNSVNAVTPAIRVYQAKNLIGLMQKAEYTFSVFIRRTFSHINALFITPGPFSIFRTSVFETLGPYKEAYHTEDLEIALRMQAAGMHIENAHRAVVYTKAPATFRALFRQRLRWSYGFLKNTFEYRFLFFRPRYGNLGLFVLPLTVLSFFGALYFLGVLAFSLFAYILAKAVEVEAVGIASFVPKTFGWFFVSTQSLVFLALILVGLTLTLVIIGRKLLAEQRTFSFDLICYLALYGLLAPLWLAKATYNVVAGEKASWR